MGAYPRPDWDPCSYELLYKASPDEESFFIDRSPAGIHAVASGPLVGDATTRSLPIASAPYPKSMAFEGFLYTTASVKNVVHVRGYGAKSDSIITGLLFRYTDGHQASVGRIPLDRLEAPVMIDVSQKMWLKVSARANHGWPRVVDIGFS
ncbi:hypothetical protein F4680DRAFT_319980 [Xylaria scruposa]|nr:hypothetical protein F4680DRAFT_319980 [Xylaria scruposa]